VAEFRWIEAGAGLPVLCLHGLFGTSEHWEQTVEALALRCRAMALTLPIFETPPDDLSVTGLRAHVEAFMDAERVPPAVVVGNSLGGHVALDLALHAPERVRALVLTGSSGLLERSFTRGVPHRPSAEFVREKMTEVFYDPAMVTPEWVEAIRGRVSHRSYILRVLQVSRSAKRYNLEDRLGEIRCPTLLVWGTDDRITPRSVAIRFLDGLPSATLRLLPYCGHAPMLEHPEAFARAVEEFLDSFEPEATAAH
jgi:pimeloyl-ACP methyl ester carboxylesterase